MLDALLKFGSYRIDYFDRSGGNPQAFAFYVRGAMDARSRFSHEAKAQLYAGLALIRSELGLGNLAAVYIDVNDLANLQRQAYAQLKRDLLAGMFSRVFVYDRSALLGQPAADQDVARLGEVVRDFELLSCDEDGSIFVRGGLPSPMLMSV
jgi:hypothetical protein